MHHMSLHDEHAYEPDPDSVAVGGAAHDPSPRAAPTPRPTLVVCPYCGHESSHHSRCDRCKGLMDPLSRQASQNAMGPWFIRDDALPFRPGCSYDTLRALIAKGRVSRQAILRGPSTRQFWTRATSVPGVAHLLGECHACHTRVSADFARCPSCSAAFECSADRQNLGLAPARLLPGHASPEEIARSMVDSLRHASPGSRAEPLPTPITRVRQSNPLADVEVPGAARPRRPLRKVWILAVVFFAVLLTGAGAIWLLAPKGVQEALRSLFDGSP